ncbi:CLUMA_CG014129, isoform A [Clunio marinus]|uniref:CLUMA_CG014129, isoform A n=1 Tax=Clunio marinus TaxID=568069 RepID=A0A1J1IP76_9DIPT|nr:CLUMA_CG014129, isoform A [Clunio marinus]
MKSLKLNPYKYDVCVYFNAFNRNPCITYKHSTEKSLKSLYSRRNFAGGLSAFGQIKLLSEKGIESLKKNK